MKIGFDAKRAFYNKTGLGNYSRTLIENLAHYYPENEYWLYTPGKGRDLMGPLLTGHQNLHSKYPRSPLGRLLPPLWRSFLLKEELRKDQPDLYHGLSHELPWKIEKTKSKSIVTIHDLIYLRYPNLFPLFDRKVYDKKFRHSCAVSDHIVAISEQTKRDLIDYFKVPAAKISVIYQSCAPSFREPNSPEQKKQISQKYNLPQDFVLYVGSLVERKNALLLLKAQKLLENKLDFPLVLVGDGRGYKKTLQNFIHKNNLQKKVTLLNKVTFTDLPALYQMAQAFVYPSIFEGFGLPIIEALWSGCPVITSQGSCFPEAGGPDSQYINPQDPEHLAQTLTKVLQDSTLKESMRTGGLHYVQRFHEKALTTELMSLYQKLLHS